MFRMKEDTKKWIKKAEDDFRVAKSMFRMKEYSYAAFWCQQSAEKAFKAVQIEKESKFDKIHDLVVLAKKTGAPEEIIEICKRLTIAYVYARYPDASSGKEDMKEISEKFIEKSKEVMKWVKSKVL